MTQSTSGSNSPRRPAVTRALFLDAGQARGAVHMTVLGDGFLVRAAPVVARVGAQWVRRIVVNSDGSGFAGILEQAPRDGDALAVGYADGDLMETDIVYRASNDGGDPGVA